eukprot:403339501
MSQPYGGIKRSYANQSASLTGIPGGYDGLRSSLRGARDTMNVDDIEGAVPRRLVGYTGARPDVLLQKEQAQFDQYEQTHKLNLGQSLTNNANQFLPAGYRQLQGGLEIGQGSGPEHFKSYEQRLLRTDDITGARPKHYGINIPQGTFAGNTSGNLKTYKNESTDILNQQKLQHDQSQAHLSTAQTLNKNTLGTTSQHRFAQLNVPQTITKPFNPQFQTSYTANYSPLRSDNIKTLQLAKPLAIDTNLMFRGHADISGGLSGYAGVGNLASSFKTNYQQNYNFVNDYQKQMDKQNQRRYQENVDKMDKDRIEKMVRESSPQLSRLTDYKRDQQAAPQIQNQKIELPEYMRDYGMQNNYETDRQKLESRSKQGNDYNTNQSQVSGIDYNIIPQEFRNQLQSDMIDRNQQQYDSQPPSQNGDALGASLRHDPSKQSLLRSSLQQNAESIIHGDKSMAGINSQAAPLSMKDQNTYMRHQQDQDISIQKKIPGQDRYQTIQNHALNDMEKSYKYLSMAPTTDQGRGHEFIDHNIQNRESLKIGNKNSGVSYEDLMPKLNDINFHRSSQRAKNNFNVLTGTYKKLE